MLTRRDFIKFLSLVGASTLSPLRRFLRLTSLEEASHQQEDTGELYADFLLLPEGAAVPNFVQYPKVPMPKLCGVGAESEDTRSDAVIHFFENHEEVAQKMIFPIYLLSPLPDGLRQGKAFSLSLDSGEFHSLSLKSRIANGVYNSPRVCYALLALNVVSLGYDTKSLPK
jgi:hypothetical protein